MKNLLVVSMLMLVSTQSYAATTVELQWDQNPDAVDGYTLHFGKTENVPATVFKTIKALPANINAANSMFVSFPELELDLNPGDTACFRIKAYNSSGSSAFSDSVCFQKKPLPSQPKNIVLKLISK